jgi:hypothetical protein
MLADAVERGRFVFDGAGNLVPPDRQCVNFPVQLS